jgi:L-fuconolactonase
MMLIDAHQHFWHYNPKEYGWISDRMEKLKRDFLPADLIPELQAMKFEGTIAVQARQSLEETRWLLTLADENNFIKGVVGWVDLCSEEAEDQLKEFSANSKFVGVRHVVHDEPDDRFMARKDFRRGISFLQKYSLTYDLLIFPKHLPLAMELVKEFPDQPFVLDHIAKPDIKGQRREPWASGIRKLAQLPNVYCKLSGMVTEADWKSWKKDDFRFYLHTVLDCFGPDRLMTGSDWPVCTLGGSYQVILAIVTDFLKEFDLTDRQKILGANCLNFYKQRESIK